MVGGGRGMIEGWYWDSRGDDIYVLIEREYNGILAFMNLGKFWFCDWQSQVSENYYMRTAPVPESIFSQQLFSKIQNTPLILKRVYNRLWSQQC